VTAAPLPWRSLIGFGLGALKLSPEAFWRMTPRELAYAAEALNGPVAMPMNRGALHDLMKRFPDGR